MVSRRLTLGVCLVSTSLAATAAAGTVTVQGTVTRAESRWAGDGTRIVTDAVVRTADGDVTVSQLGGTVDGIGMTMIPGAPLLRTGQRATVTAHHASTARGRATLVVDDVVIEADAPALRKGTSRADFVQSGPTDGGRYVYWASGCVRITYAAEGTAHLPGETELAILDRTLATWTGVACSYITLDAVGRAADAEVGNDRVNLIKFRDQQWCRPAVGDDPPRCLPRNAAGVTTLTFIDDPDSSRDGEILDADVELNGVDFAISDDGDSLGRGCQADLANTMTHELGHVLGFAHTCLLETGTTTQLDAEGVAVPTCTRAQAQRMTRLLEATMFPSQACGETEKATLAADDIEAVCTQYPVDGDPATCEAPAPLSSGCCSTSGRDGAAGSILLAVATLLGLRRRRPR